jgi:hypothetical protein
VGTDERIMYLVTKQYSADQPFERELVRERDVAIVKALELSGLRAPTDLSEWDRLQGNQHKPTRWRFTYYKDGNIGEPIHIKIRKFNVDQ